MIIHYIYSIDSRNRSFPVRCFSLLLGDALLLGERRDRAFDDGGGGLGHAGRGRGGGIVDDQRPVRARGDEVLLLRGPIPRHGGLPRRPPSLLDAVRVPVDHPGIEKWI